MKREDFEMIDNGLIYLDNGATTFKPKVVVDSITDYYTKYCANAHRGDYDISRVVDELYEGTRKVVKDFIGAYRREEIIFTKGTTNGLNMIVFGFMRNYLQAGDEVLVSKSEHASNLLPWLELEKKLGIVVKYIPLTNDYKLVVDNVVKSVTPKTKVISIAHITNVIGDVRDITTIGSICKRNNILFVVDGAQSVPHMKIDVIKSNIDFLVFSGHKMLGPTGIGILYGKYNLLYDMDILEFGGGMVNFYGDDYKDIPNCFEAGTQNIEGVIGLRSAILYLEDIGLDNISKYEKSLKKYFLEEVSCVDNIILYNRNSESSIVTFNIKGVDSSELATLLNKYKICIRAGSHCVTLLKDELGINNTCRISFYLYNTKEEIDKVIDVLKRSEDLLKKV